MLKRSTKIILGLVIVLCANAYAQDKEYTYKFSAVDFLKEPDINSKSEEIFPLYNKAYDTMFFVRSHHYDNIGKNKDNFDIWYTYKKDGKWTESINLEALNNSSNNSVVGIGEVSKSLYLINSYSSTVIRNQGISKTTFIKGKWTRPEPIEFYVDTQRKVYSFFMNHTEDVIVITMYNNLSEGEEDLFVSLKSEDGRWRDPLYLGHDINSSGFETSPFLTDDKKTLFFTSNGFEGYGNGDVYMSKRLDDTWLHWSTPENLGKNVNSDKFDGYFSLYENGKFMLSSNRDTQYADIFEGTWELVEVVKPAKEEKIVVKEVIKEKSLIDGMPKSIRVQFKSNSFVFDENKYNADFESSVNFLNANPNVGLVVEGNTDKVGDEIYNLVLSHKRATGVANYLKAKLADSDKDRVMVMPNGEVNATNDQEESRVVVVKFVVLNAN
ncbi:OmpA family protein [Reichenbachiella sp. MALMAid0571]|uniref:OmpA family protein n=1 Tax=Reichenbachiella sp. MALMAid0571 TaxID=3143939 RepID=UPI0032E01297